MVYGRYLTNDLRKVTLDSTRTTIVSDQLLFQDSSSVLAVQTSPVGPEDLVRRPRARVQAPGLSPRRRPRRDRTDAAAPRGASAPPTARWCNAGAMSLSRPRARACPTRSVTVVDFRYHLVSIIAVFLALAIGIVIGTTALNGALLDNLKGSINAPDRRQARPRDDDHRAAGSRPRPTTSSPTGSAPPRSPAG